MKITKSELREIIQEVADELGLFEGLTAAQEKLPEPLKKAILKKQGNQEESDEETIEEVTRYTHTYNTNALESSFNIYMFKRDLGYNNVPYKSFVYDSELNKNNSYKIDNGQTN